ncbi:hypothetical protein HDU87_007851 [Geranomyces variabilis]|uniref:Uncharacterized protein n=1 Tax=Geranomyces variabilis TaxID=109894 RepID=A0AAD5TIZ0_9FUNG|nr:hypothetical protein HDU87_007851 [Geranomyces variabilis]
MGSGASKKRAPAAATDAAPDPAPAATEPSPAQVLGAKIDAGGQPSPTAAPPGRTVTSVSATAPVARATKPRPARPSREGEDEGDDESTGDADSARFPPLRGGRALAAAADLGVKARDVEEPRIEEHHPPKFDKEKFKRANKEMPVESMPAAAKTLAAAPPAVEKKATRFLDEDDEDFMAAILRDTEFVAQERSIF